MKTLEEFAKEARENLSLEFRNTKWFQMLESVVPIYYAKQFDKNSATFSKEQMRWLTTQRSRLSEKRMTMLQKEIFEATLGDYIK